MPESLWEACKAPFSSSGEAENEKHEGAENSQSMFEEEKLEDDLEDRKDDLKNIKSKIRRSYNRYKDSLERAKERKGIDEVEAKAEAKAEKAAAKQHEAVYKLLWKEYMTLRTFKIKVRQHNILSESTYSVNFSDISAADVGKLSEKYDELIRKREQKVNELQRESTSRTDDDIEIDFSDIEKDVRELETNDIQLEIEADDGTVHTIEPENDF